MSRAPRREARKHNHDPSIPRNGSARGYCFSTAMALSEDASNSKPSSAYHPVTTHRPFLVVERIGILLEEGLFSAAIANAASVLFSGISDTPPKPGILVPANFLQFLTTLIVHPFYTTQTRTKASPQKAPEEAHVFIKRVIEVVGPISSDLSAAWKFRGNPSVAGSKRKRSNVNINDDGAEYKDEFQIHSPLAEEESLFAVAPDLWAVVGWGFNCSVSHKKRWCCYRNVLDVFLRAFEKDLEQRIDRWKEEKVEKKKASHLDGALLLKMLPAGRSTSDIRRVVNSIFAKGGSKTDYGKLWSDELKRRRTKALGKKEIGRTIADDDGETDSEAEMSGLSDDETEMKDSEGDVMMGDQGPQTVNVVDMWGGVEAVEMRQRFLTLLSTYCYFSDKFITTYQLHEVYKDAIRPLPVSSFSLFVSTNLDAAFQYHMLLCMTILNTLVTTKAPYQSIENIDITLENFTKAYLPYMANTTSLTDNVKMAILVEVVLRLMMNKGWLVWSQELEDKAEEGIAARRKQGKTNKAGHSREENLAAWDGADMRLRMLVKMAKIKMEKMKQRASETPANATA